LLGGQGGECASGQDDINLERNQFGCESGEPLELPLVRSVFDHEVAALDVTEVTQSLAEGLSDGGRGRAAPKYAYASDLGRLLRLTGERRGEEAGDCREEDPAFHHGAPSSNFFSAVAKRARISSSRVRRESLRRRRLSSARHRSEHVSLRPAGRGLPHAAQTGCWEATTPERSGCRQSWDAKSGRTWDQAFRGPAAGPRIRSST
jgi:hypothetical protein